MISPNAGEDAEKQDPSYIAGGNVKWYSRFGRQFGSLFLLFFTFLKYVFITFLEREEGAGSLFFKLNM